MPKRDTASHQDDRYYACDHQLEPGEREFIAREHVGHQVVQGTGDRRITIHVDGSVV